MDQSVLLTGPNHETLERQAFGRVDELAGTEPGSILYLSRYDARRSTVADNWADRHQSLRLRVENLNSVVRDCFEQLAGPSTTPTGALNRRLTEYALDGLAADPSYWFGTPPVSTRLAGAFETRFSLFGDVGLLTANDLEATLTNTALEGRIVDLVTDTYERYNTLLSECTPEWTHTRAEAFAAVRTAGQPLSELLPNVDAVILSGYHEFRPVERAIVERLVESFPTIALLSLHGDGDEGVDAAVTDALSIYEQLGFGRKTIEPEYGNVDLQRVAAALYRDPPVTVPTTTTSLSWRELPTPEREVRFVARELKRALADGCSPDELTVVVPRIEAYHEYVADTFDAFDVPYAMATPRPLDQTMVGQAVTDVLALADKRPRADRLTTLLSNPLVTAFPPEASTAVTAASRRRDSTSLDTILPDLDETLRASVDSLRKELSLLDECEVVEGTDRLEAVLDSLGVREGVKTYASGETRTVERRAIAKVDEVLTSFKTVADVRTPVSTVALLRRSFEDVPIRSSTPHAAGRVEVLGFLDTGMQSFEQVYLVGLTAENFPAIVQRPTFFERMTDAVPELDPGDERERTRYLFATLLANANSLTLTTPAADDDSAVVRSPILTELERVTGVEPEIGIDDRIGAREDLQRAISTREDRRAALDATGDHGAFSAEQTIRADRGITCASNRRQDGLSQHGGVLNPSTVEEVYPRSDREPYSVSRIERYVNCGYRFYMEQILDIEAPEEVERTPTPLETGGYVHDVFEQFYTDLQGTTDEGVDLTNYNHDRLESDLLDAALDSLPDDPEFQYSGSFYRRWVETLFAGLDNAEDNPHYGGERPHTGTEDGLFVRFLDHELSARNDSLPTWFEQSFGEGLPDSRPGDRFEIELPDGESIALRGYIDRIDRTMGEDGLDIHLYDYKTGYVPYLTTVTGGTTFQLPVYLAAAAATIDEEISDFDASYYQTKPPNQLKTPGGIASKFDSQAELQRFLDEIVPERLATIKRAIENGQFHTTLLSAGDAGCEYCDYRRICEVRPHRKRDRITNLQEDQQTYVPQRVRDDSFDELFGGE